jgi:hypothetical protein
MGRRPLLSDEMVELRLQQHEKLRYCWRLTGRNSLHAEAEIIGPRDSEFFGRTAFGSDKSRAISNLIGQLGRHGFIGRLVEGPITGRA